MKQALDKFTPYLFEKRECGRPRKIDAKSSTQHQAEYRSRQKLYRAISATRNENSGS